MWLSIGLLIGALIGFASCACIFLAAELAADLRRKEGRDY